MKLSEVSAPPQRRMKLSEVSRLPQDIQKPSLRINAPKILGEAVRATPVGASLTQPGAQIRAWTESIPGYAMARGLRVTPPAELKTPPIKESFGEISQIPRQFFRSPAYRSSLTKGVATDIVSDFTTPLNLLIPGAARLAGKIPVGRGTLSQISKLPVTRRIFERAGRIAKQGESFTPRSERNLAIAEALKTNPERVAGLRQRELAPKIQRMIAGQPKQLPYPEGLGETFTHRPSPPPIERKLLPPPRSLGDGFRIRSKEMMAPEELNRLAGGIGENIGRQLGHQPPVKGQIAPLPPKPAPPKFTFESVKSQGAPGKERFGSFRFKSTEDAVKYGKQIAGDEAKIAELQSEKEALMVGAKQIKDPQARMDSLAKSQLLNEAMAEARKPAPKVEIPKAEAPAKEPWQMTKAEFDLFKGKEAEKFAESIKETIKEDPYADWGIRVLPDRKKPYKIGEILGPSYVWVDGVQTEGQLKGTSSIGVTEGNAMMALGDAAL